MSRQEILLKEHELCQNQNISSANHYWIVAGTFLTINTAAFGGIAYSTLKGDIGYGLAFWVVLFVTVAFVSVLWFLRLYRRRVDFAISVSYERMREIELELEMWKNWRIYGIDEFKNNKFSDAISDDMKKRLFIY